MVVEIGESDLAGAVRCEHPAHGPAAAYPGGSGLALHPHPYGAALLQRRVHHLCGAAKVQVTPWIYAQKGADSIRAELCKQRSPALADALEVAYVQGIKVPAHSAER